jgi:hypothetical protein
VGAIVIDDQLHSNEEHAIRQGVVAFGDAHTPPRNYRPLHLGLRSPEGRLLGGLLGSLVWDWLQIDVLWVDTAERGRGVRPRLAPARGGGRPRCRLLARPPGHVRLRGAWLLREARVCRVRCARRLPARAYAVPPAQGVAVNLVRPAVSAPIAASLAGSLGSRAGFQRRHAARWAAGRDAGKAGRS